MALGSEHQHQQAFVHFSPSVDSTDSTSSPDAEAVLLGLSPATRQLMEGLLRCDPTTRLSVTDACAHAFFSQATPLARFSSSPSASFSEEEAWVEKASARGIDPRSFHLCEPVKLPRRAGGGEGPPQGEDRAWARRQCSMVWSPVLKTYDFQAETEAGTDAGRGGASGAAGRMFAVLERERINETAEESGGSWLP